mgnify:CR=1 FL=1
MKKNVLALSIAAMIGGLGFAGAASAQVAVDTLQVNESGTGHMLLMPYYTAQNGNMTVFHVVNTDTSNGKAMKVRFRGASNSDDVLDFQVFMSPGDVWTAAVVKGANDVASLVTADGTCTLPAIAKNTPVSFVQDRLPAAMPAADKANNTREGYVEIFNMADIDSSKQAVYGGVGNTIPVNAPLYTAIKHVNGVAPCSDSVLQGTLATGAGTPGLLPPTDGLMGSWYIIFTKLFEQRSMLKSATNSADAFWKASSVKSGVTALEEGSAFRYIAEAGIKASDKNMPRVACDAALLPFPDRSADAVTISFGIRNVVEIDQALVLGPEHLSCYGLTYEPNTALTKRLELRQVDQRLRDPAAQQAAAHWRARVVEHADQCVFGFAARSFEPIEPAWARFADQDGIRRGPGADSGADSGAGCRHCRPARLC